MFDSMLNGLLPIFQPLDFSLMLLGIAIGLVVGILPGISGVTALVILTPFVYNMNPALALILLLSVHTVSNNGGSVTAILMNIPGDAQNAATLVDGFPMTQQGHPGRALGISLTSSSIGGIFGVMVLVLLIPLARPVMMALGSAEIFLFVLMGISFIASLSSGSVVKGMLAAFLGILFSLVGYAQGSGEPRMTFGWLYLFDGIRLIPLALGLFAVTTTFELMSTGETLARTDVAVPKKADLIDGVKTVFRHWWLMVRCSVLGTLVGFIPAIGGTTAVWLAYGHAKSTSKHPEKFGTGYEEGIIAPEAAGNAKEGGALIPTLAFGIPGSTSTAILLGIFLVLGLQPGPLFLKEHPDLAFTMAWTVALGNVLASVVLALFTVQLVKVAFVPGRILGPFILGLVAIGAFANERNFTDVIFTFIFGGLGYAMTRLDYPKPALFLGFVLGLLAEQYFLITWDVYGLSFLTRPIVLVLVFIIILSLAHRQVGALWKALFPTRRKVKIA